MRRVIFNSYIIMSMLIGSFIFQSARGQSPLFFSLNAGGASYTDINGTNFVTDKPYVAGDYGFVNGSTITFNQPISGTNDDPLYQTFRYNENGSFSYVFDNLPTGDYSVTLHFTEPVGTAPGMFLMDIAAEGAIILNDYDVFSASGGQFIAHTETLTVTVIDGQLNLDFTPLPGSVAHVCAISVVQIIPPAPDINITPLSLDFGQVVTGSFTDMGVMIENQGTQDLVINNLQITSGDFSVISPSTPLTIPAGAPPVNVTVRFSPITVGLQSSQLQVGSNDPDEPLVNIPLIGTGILSPVPDIAVSNDSLDFGTVTIGTFLDKSLTISNLGTSDLTVSGLVISGGAFTIISPSTPFTISPGGAPVNVTVRFTPGSAGNQTASLDITSNDPDEPNVMVTLIGQGIIPPPVTYRINAGGNNFIDSNGKLFNGDKAFVPGDFGYSGGSTITFNNPIAGTNDDLLYQTFHYAENASLSYIFDNLPSGNYNVILHFSEPVATSSGFFVFDVSMEGNIVLNDFDVFAAAGGQFIAYSTTIPITVTDGQLNIQFTQVIGTVVHICAIEVIENTNPTPQPDIQLSTTSLNFGNLQVGTSGNQALTISNLGNADLTLTNFNITSGEFSIVSPTLPLTIPANAPPVNVVLKFAPTFSGPQNGNLEISSNDPDEGISIVTLSGNGVAIPTTTYQDVAGQIGLILDHPLGNPCDPPIGSGSAWADFDNDGDIDLFVTVNGGANRMYRNDGDLNGDGLPDFTEIAAGLGIADPSGQAHGAVFIDFDNDHDQDLYVTNRGGNSLYRNELMETGNAVFTDITSIAGLSDGGRAVTASWGDFDQDGYLDVYLAKHGYCLMNDLRNQDHLYKNNGDGTFTDVTGWLCNGTAPCPQVNGLGFSAGWVDYDNDGDLDLYLVNDNINQNFYPNVLWRNDGSDGQGGWIFTDVSNSSGTNVSLNGMGLGIGDFNNDGYLDFAFSNMGPNYLLQNNGDGTFSDISSSAGIQRATTPAGDMSVTWGTAFFDYDNNGLLDLLYVAGHLGPTYVDQPNAFFENNGDGTFSDISVASGLNDPARGRNASIVDFDEDGYIDVFVGNFGVAPNLFHNQSILQGNLNNWLTFTLEGVVSNFDAIGSRITITTPDSTTQIREISSGPTHGGGDYRAAYFGLGNNSTADVTVRWPNGSIQNFGTIAANQKLHLIEGVPLPKVGDNIELSPHPQQFALHYNYPNPFNPSTTIQFDITEASHVTLKIYNVLGKEVRTLVNDYRQSGTYHVMWDGKDDSGSRVSSGIYFYRLTANENVAVRKMNLIQ